MIRSGHSHSMNENLSQQSSVQDLIDEEIWEADSEEVSQAKKYLKELKCSSLDDLLSVTEDDDPKEYEALINLAKDVKALKTPAGVSAGLVEINGIKLVTEGCWGYYSIYYNRKDAAKLTAAIKSAK